MDTLEINGWKGRLGQGLAPRQLEALLYSAMDLTMKEVARHMGCSPNTVQQQLDDARFKLGMQRTTRGLCIEAIRRGIISPLLLLLCLSTCFSSADRPTPRPIRTVRVADFARAPRQEIA